MEAAPESPAKATSASVRLSDLASRANKPIYGITVDPLLFFAAVLTDYLRERTVGYWLARAETFDSIDPLVALNCRRHAWLLADMDDGEISEDVWNVLTEVAA